jgi:hypothetical protein
VLGIKSWCEGIPACAAARPGTCTCCKAAAQPVGGRLVIVGHGLVERQVLGPQSAGGRPAALVVKLRRYRCRECRAILVVGPRGLVLRRVYGAGAIALAFAAYGHGATSVAVRARTSPWRVVGGSAADRWPTLVRWIEAARRGKVFGVAGLGDLDRRGVAKQVVLVLAGRGGHVLGEDLSRSAFEGAVIAA